MELKEKIKELCKNRKISIAGLEKKLGFANAYIQQLNPESVPYTRIKKIADYFGVTPGYFFDEDENTNPFEKQILQAFHSLNDEGKSKTIEYADMLSRMPEYQKGETSSDSKDGVKNA